MGGPYTKAGYRFSFPYAGGAGRRTLLLTGRWMYNTYSEEKAMRSRGWIGIYGALLLASRYCVAFGRVARPYVFFHNHLGYATRTPNTTPVRHPNKREMAWTSNRAVGNLPVVREDWIVK